MKEGWEYKTLGECCDILDRLRKPIKQSKRESGNIPYYGATGLLDYVNDYIFDDTLVLLGEDGAKWGAGDDSAFIISGKTWVNNHAHVLKPYTFLNERYLVYYLKMSNLSDYITGVTVPKLNQEKMRQIIIPLTTLDEQRRIVSYLDSSFKLIDEVKNKALKSLTEAKALFQSALAEAMEPKEGWEYKTLGECCDILDRLRKPIKQSKRESGNIPYYGATGLLDYVNDYIFDDTLVLLGEDGAKWGAGDDSAFIISGKTWVNNHAHVLKPYTFLNERYLVYYLKMSNLSDYVTGVTVPKLNQEKMRQIIIPLTTLNEQRQIVSHLDKLSSKVRTIEEKYQKMVEECDSLKQAMLRDVFE